MEKVRVGLVGRGLSTIELRMLAGSLSTHAIVLAESSGPPPVDPFEKIVEALRNAPPLCLPPQLPRHDPRPYWRKFEKRSRK
jgi:hypothetical protein